MDSILDFLVRQKKIKLNKIKFHHQDLIKRQAEMYQSNIECIKKTNYAKD